MRSVLEQDCDDFELVVSDNANDDATPDVIRGMAEDPRLVALRQPLPLGVTQNWTAAFTASRGDHLLVLGDDDYLLPGALRRLTELLERHADPDCILFNGYSYVSPNSIGDNSQSYWAPEHFHYGPVFHAADILGRAHRMEIVRDMFRFRHRIPLNMQTALFSRRSALAARGGVFRPPFPDHYLLHALLLDCDRWAHVPERLVIIGVSPKSFGHHVYTQRSADGLAYLGIDTHFPGALPGSALLNGTCSWLIDLKAMYPEHLAGIELDRAGYVRRQIHWWILQHRYGALPLGEIAARLLALSPRDWLAVLATIIDAESWRRLARVARSHRSQAETLWGALRPLPDIASIGAFAAWLAEGHEIDAKT
jgi:glycosyltransferase involved in cell wall biosynthesis